MAPDSLFAADTLYSDFSDGLASIGTSAARGSTDGQWKSGFYAHNYSTYGMDWAQNGVINNERQIYHSPDRPHPDGWTPYSINNGNLVVTSSTIDPGNSAEVAWATNKTYHLTPTGQLATAAFFTAANGYPQGVPTNWGQASEEGSGGPILFYEYPMIYKSGMLSTYGNRHSIGMGRREVRCTIPAGGRVDNLNDINLIKAVFAASGWDLQDFPLGRGVNGEVTDDPDNITYVPHSDGPQKTEIDYSERFGASLTDLHFTIHYYNGAAQIQQIPHTYNSGIDLSTQLFTVTCDVGPEKTSFAFNGVVQQVVDTPDEVKNPLPLYETVAGQPYNVVRENGKGKIIGTQTNDDGSDRYMAFAQIMNIARDGKYPRDLAASIVNGGGSLPPYNDTVSMEIEYYRAAPLLDAPQAGQAGTSAVIPSINGDVVMSPLAVIRNGTALSIKCTFVSSGPSAPVSYQWSHNITSVAASFTDSTSQQTDLVLSGVPTAAETATITCAAT